MCDRSVDRRNRRKWLCPLWMTFKKGSPLCSTGNASTISNPGCWLWEEGMPSRYSRGMVIKGHTRVEVLLASLPSVACLVSSACWSRPSTGGFVMGPIKSVSGSTDTLRHCNSAAEGISSASSWSERDSSSSSSVSETKLKELWPLLTDVSIRYILIGALRVAEGLLWSRKPAANIDCSLFFSSWAGSAMSGGGAFSGGWAFSNVWTLRWGIVAGGARLGGATVFVRFL
mmetsp:Transcript_6940/g.13101  ORF Transcript_6940/g.13101 Transcript_6940/m.13101 type:complete len:229 (+) Transcript_6940:1986-2672(+)